MIPQRAKRQSVTDKNSNERTPTPTKQPLEANAEPEHPPTRLQPNSVDRPHPEVRRLFNLSDLQKSVKRGADPT